MKTKTDTAAQAGVIEAITALMEPVVMDLGLELVEVQFRPEQVGWVLRLIIDNPAGVSLDDCTLVSREAGALLDVEDVISHPYHLEVSSPGLDRPLRTVRDFIRCRGRKVKVTTREPLGRFGSAVEGTIESAGDDGVVLLVDPRKDERLTLPLALIAKAKLVVEF